MNGITLVVFDGTERVHWFTNDVQHAAERSLADGHRDWATSVDGFHSADHTVRGQHRDRPYASFAEVLLHFRDDVDR